MTKEEDLNPSSPSESLSKMSLNFSSTIIRDWLGTRKKLIRPWTLFLKTSNFSSPGSAARVAKRFPKNLEYFQSNYVCVFLVLFFYCLITSPLLLIVMGAVGGACYIVKLKQAERKLILGGKEISTSQQYGIIGLCSIPLLLLAGAGSAVFWVLGASFFFIALHSSFYNYDVIDADDQESLTGTIMEEV